MIFYIFTILQITPLFLALIPALAAMSIYTFVTRFIPSTLFIAPIEPIHMQIVSAHGIPVYGLSTKHQANESFVRGAVTAIHHIFKTYVDDSSNLKSIRFNNLECYVEWREHFFIVYIDKFESKYVQKKIDRFADEIAPEMSLRLPKWDGDMQKFDDIGQLFQKRFNFLMIFFNKQKFSTNQQNVELLKVEQESTPEKDGHHEAWDINETI